MQKEITINNKEYRIKEFKEDLEKNLLIAEDDIENGRVKDAEDVYEEWKKTYGI